MVFKTTHELFKMSFNILGAGADYLIKGPVNKKTGAQFAKNKNLKGFISPQNKGLLIDGENGRLSEKESFQNVAVYGVTGTGKSSTFVVPNILDKADKKTLLIVNDMSGDICRDTSGHMQSKGYKVIVLNPHDLENSHRYNPFMDLQSESETIHLAQMFVQAVAGNGDNKDNIWSAGAERFVTFFLRCLRKKGPEFNNPHNLYYLFQNFGEDGSNLHSFVSECCIDDNGNVDNFMVNEWKSLLGVHKDGILSFIMNATTALKIFSDRDVCTLTSSSDFDITSIRKQKTIIYVISKPQYQKMYRPLTSMYFLSLLQACMRELPGRNTLPAYFIYDEFGNSFLPDFDTFATTVRKYQISLMLFMQGINQLVKSYGKNTTSVILSGITTQISFGAAEQETAEYFSRRVGKVRMLQRPKASDPQIENHSEHNLINASEIRELPAGKLLVISNNRPTALIDALPCYRNGKFKRMMKREPAVIKTSGAGTIRFLPL